MMTYTANFSQIENSTIMENILQHLAKKGTYEAYDMEALKNQAVKQCGSLR